MEETGHRIEMNIACYSDMFGAERHFVSDFSTRDAGAVADGFMQEFKNRFLTGAILKSVSHMIRQTSTNWPHPLSPKGKYGYGLDDVDSIGNCFLSCGIS